MNNTLVILGNGFDLDMGWKTSYKDFLESEKFSVLGEPRYVMDYTKELFRRMGNNWYDLEGFMRECIENATEKEVDTLNDFWQICRNKIYDYLTNNGEIFKTNNSSCAYLFLKKISDANVFSFNYTLPYKITHFPEREITYLHGALGHGLSWMEIKLGIDLHVKNKLAWNDKLKPYLKTYKSDKIDLFFAAMKKADRIIIYGHSLGITDSDYFEPIFEEIISGKLSNKSLYFITKNSHAMQCVKDNMSMYGIDYSKLNNASYECKNIYTDNGIDDITFRKVLDLI